MNKIIILIIISVAMIILYLLGNDINNLLLLIPITIGIFILGCLFFITFNDLFREDEVMVKLTN